MSDQRSPGWQGLSFLLSGLAVLGWEWSHNHDIGTRGPSRTAAIILAPLICLMGLKRLLARGGPEPRRDFDGWADPFVLFGVLLGIVNAYLLGVWRLVSREGLWEFAPLLIIAGLVTGVILVRKRRAKARTDAFQK